VVRAHEIIVDNAVKPSYYYKHSCDRLLSVITALDTSALVAFTAKMLFANALSKQMSSSVHAA